MKDTIRWRWLGMMLVGILALTTAGGSPAQEKKKPSKEHDAAALNTTLRGVINAGARMFNDHGDHLGCYRLWQGSLMSIRPFVPPDMQQTIDKGLMNAERMVTFADRAFELRRVLDEIRAKTKPADAVGGKTIVAGDKGQVAGRLMYQGKPVAGGYFVTLVSRTDKKFSSAIQKDGAFQFKTPIPTGAYRVAIEPIPDDKLKGPTLPARYGLAESSGLSIQVQAGKQQVDLNLVK